MKKLFGYLLGLAIMGYLSGVASAASIDIDTLVLDFGELPINQESNPSPIQITYTPDSTPTTTPPVVVSPPIVPSVNTPPSYEPAPTASGGASGGGSSASYTSSYSGGGGSSGGGSSYSYVPPSSFGTSQSNSNSSVTTTVFTRAINVGSNDAEVVKLQTALARDPSIYPEGKITGFYGPATQKAVEKFQSKYGIAYSGNPTTTGYGNVGLKTVQKLNEVFASGSPVSMASSNSATNTTGCTASTKYSPITGAPCSLTSSSGATTGGAPLAYTYTRTLSLGMKGSDVTLLQTILARDASLYPEAQITGFYGPATQKAVQRLQVRNNIINYGTPATTGYGAVGKKTAAVVGRLIP